MAAPGRVSLVLLSVLVAVAGCGSGPAVAASPAAVPEGTSLTAPASTAAAADAAASPDATAVGSPRLTSPDFPADGTIPTRFTCKGAGDRPTLNWSGVPAAANSIAIVVTDPDAPRGPFTHWIAYDLPTAPSGTVAPGPLPTGARESTNSAGGIGWKPPCPPSGLHHYHFVLYADRGPIAGGSPADTEAQIRKQAVASASLIGTVAAS